MPTPTLQNAVDVSQRKKSDQKDARPHRGKQGGRLELSLTCVEHGQTVARAQCLRLLETDFPWDVDVEQVNLGGENMEVTDI